MLYLDYPPARAMGAESAVAATRIWRAVAFLRRANELVHEHGGFTIAEVVHRLAAGVQADLSGWSGFGYKWHMGWMRARSKIVYRPIRSTGVTAS